MAEQENIPPPQPARPAPPLPASLSPSPACSPPSSSPPHNHLDIRFDWEPKKASTATSSAQGGYSRRNEEESYVLEGSKAQNTAVASLLFTSDNNLSTTPIHGIEYRLITKPLPTASSSSTLSSSSIPSSPHHSSPHPSSPIPIPSHTSSSYIRSRRSSLQLPHRPSNLNLADKMPRQSVFIYLDRDAVISILSTLEHMDPTKMDIYLHSQVSISQEARGFCHETTVSDFLEAFMDPMLDPTITRRLRTCWWSLECTLPNGVIIIHSLSQSLYDNVFIFKFSPVTGVFCKLVPQEISDMRGYVQNQSKEYNPKLFPRVPAAQKNLSDREKLRAQLASGGSGPMRSAARSMTNLANTVGRRLSGSSFNMTTMSSGILTSLKNSIIPNLMSWNSAPSSSSFSFAGFTTHPNITTAALSSPQKGQENRPSVFKPKRQPFLRSAPATYIRHPLQTLRHHGSSVSVLSPAPLTSGDSSDIINTPAIILTTPEETTAILKLRASVPKVIKGKGFWQSMGETLTPKKFDTPTFVFWKDVFDQISFDTKVPNKASATFPVELNTNIYHQVADNLDRLLVGLTDMYVKKADGMQLDFIRMKIPSDEEDHQPFNVRMYQSSREASKPETEDPSKPKDLASLMATMMAEPSSAATGEEGEGAESEGSSASTALSDGAEPTEEEVGRQGQMLANNLKPDQKVRLDLQLSELEFSSVLLSQDTYLVEAVLAGWLADASEWIKESGLRWRHMLFDRQAH
ncbi:hypothetical protein TWF481_011428 [Arthrobotrys musiformis]|uniref:Uncharacterized protein n=1 Tax=Arthrobotrys musiformis TaxID=47236 RepID=A0AAV9VZR1_9PEZI